MDNKSKYKYKNCEINQKDLEDKLEKDNILLKDQIHKLQDTIKNLKYDVPATEETIEEMSTKPNKTNNYISTIKCKKKDSKKNSPVRKNDYNTNNYNSNKLLDNEDESNDLMFSFNINSKNNNGSSVRNNQKENKNGAFNTVDYSEDEFDEKLKSKNTLYEKEILSK